MTLTLVDVPVEEWDGDVADGEDRPLVVTIPVTKLLEDIQRGVDAANSALALKASTTDLADAKRTLHDRIDEVSHELRGRVGAVEQALARSSGWRSGFLVAIGAGGGLATGLILRVVEIIK